MSGNEASLKQEAHEFIRGNVTSRTKKYGKQGDFFFAFGAKFQLVAEPFLLPLKEIIMEWKAEGFESIGDFQLTWCRIHPRRKFEDLEEKFWVHAFRKIGEALGSSERLSIGEEADVSDSLKEIGEGKAKKFADAEEMIKDLKKVKSRSEHYKRT